MTTAFSNLAGDGQSDAMSSGNSSSSKSLRPVAIWLFAVAGLVALMVLVGGATRLTDSGLSITEWKPVTGAIPPLSEAHWLEEFEKYKQIPEYEEVNFGMSLDDFKVIYWWEWGHRFLGRIIGLAFLGPLLVFAATGRLTRALGGKLTLLFVLGGAQGALGWWMVSSGLTERVDVSQYRLAAHLGLAILLFGALLWTAFDLISVKRDRALHIRPYAFGLAAVIYAQVILGAFVAGLRAGWTYNTWPLMDGRFFPRGYFAGEPGFNDLFETIEAVQFNHRTGAYVVIAAALLFFLIARKTEIGARAHWLMAAAFVQVFLGIWTLVAATPLSLGLMHQAGALVLFALSLCAAHGCGREMSSSKPVSSS